MPNRLVQDNQAGIKDQEPSITFLTKDKFGGTNFQPVGVQTNRVSKRFLTSIWIENLVLSPGIMELVPKLGSCFALGCLISVLIDSGNLGAFVVLPVLSLVIWVIMETFGTYLQWAVWLLCSMLIIGFMVSL